MAGAYSEDIAVLSVVDGAFLECAVMRVAGVDSEDCVVLSVAR